MIKVKSGIASREPIPQFLIGLAPESLNDLAWTDPALGVQDCAWWPEEDQSPVLSDFQRYGAESLTVDAQRKVVVVVRVVEPWSAEEIAAELEARRAEKTKMVDAERDRRIAAGFTFAGVLYQSRPADWEVYSGKALEAFIAVMSGSAPGNLRWADADTDFAWIAADNSHVPMDAQTVIELAKAASAHRTELTFAGSDIKALNPIPDDYADDKWWP